MSLHGDAAFISGCTQGHASRKYALKVPLSEIK